MEEQNTDVHRTAWMRCALTNTELCRTNTDLCRTNTDECTD